MFLLHFLLFLFFISIGIEQVICNTLKIDEEKDVSTFFINVSLFLSLVNDKY